MGRAGGEGFVSVGCRGDFYDGSYNEGVGERMRRKEVSTTRMFRKKMVSVMSVFCV